MVSYVIERPQSGIDAAKNSSRLRSRPLRVLMAHNRYLERGGEDGSFAAEVALLREHGCDVDVYERDNREIERRGTLRTGLGAIWSNDTYRDVRAMLKRGNFDAVHVQNFFPLISPAIYYAARAENVPVVQTIRNYRLLCPDANLLRDGRTCEECVGKFFAWPAIVHGCYHKSRAASASVATMLTAHRAAGTWRGMVDRYVALTEFSRAKLIEGGLPADKISVKPNFVLADPGPRHGEGGYFIYVGRLSREKGVATLIDAWERAAVDARLLIVGSGPEEEELRERCKAIGGVEFLGQKPVSDIYELVGNAIALCFPSLCYENFPRTILEAFAVATPVIAHRNGTIPEIISDGVTGELVEMGDAAAMAERLRNAAANPREMASMGKSARRVFEDRYTAEANFRQLMEIYRDASTEFVHD